MYSLNYFLYRGIHSSSIGQIYCHHFTLLNGIIGIQQNEYLCTGCSFVLFFILQIWTVLKLYV